MSTNNWERKNFDKQAKVKLYKTKHGWFSALTNILKSMLGLGRPIKDLDSREIDHDELSEDDDGDYTKDVAAITAALGGTFAGLTLTPTSFAKAEKVSLQATSAVVGSVSGLQVSESQTVTQRGSQNINVAEASTRPKGRTVTVTSSKALQKALTDRDVSTINLKSDLSVQHSLTMPARNVTINGHGHQLNFGNRIAKVAGSHDQTTNNITVKNVHLHTANAHGAFAMGQNGDVQLIYDNVSAEGGTAVWTNQHSAGVKSFEAQGHTTIRATRFYTYQGTTYNTHLASQPGTVWMVAPV